MQNLLAGVLLLVSAALSGTLILGQQPAQVNGQVAVLIYHHLAPHSEREEEPGVITPARFESHLQMLKAEGYRVLSATEFAAYLDGHLVVPGKSVVITFDDGYESNYTLGFPLIRTYNVHAIIFPVMKFFATEGKGAWSPHLTKEQAQEMLASGLVAFGGHSFDGHGTVPTDPAGLQRAPWLAAPAWLSELARLETPDEYRARIRADLQRTEATLRALGVNDSALHFALPNGASSLDELEILKDLGFRYIYTTDDSQVNRDGQSPASIYRINAGSPYASDSWLRERLAQAFTNSPK